MLISDWSSDACSSDLCVDIAGVASSILATPTIQNAATLHGLAAFLPSSHALREIAARCVADLTANGAVEDCPGDVARSEERREGKEGFSRGRSRWETYH